MMRRLVALVWVLFLLWGPSASAQARERIAEAREHYQHAVDLYARNEWQAACDEFDRAYEIAPSNKLLYDIGLCRDRLGDYAIAIARLEAYLSASDVPPERREEVLTMLRALREKVAFVTVSANVTGVDLVVDDTAVGKMSSSPVVVNPGHRKIWATKPGYYPASKEVTVAAGGHADLAFELSQIPRAAEAKPLLRRPLTWGVAASGALLVALIARTLARRRAHGSGERSPGEVPRIDVFGASAKGEEAPFEPTPEHARAIVCDADADANAPAPSRTLTLEASGLTDIGRVKPTNQDSLLVRPASGLFVVADGIGGYAGGEVASATAVDIIARAFDGGHLSAGRLTHLPAAAAELAQAMFAANAEVRAKAAADWNIADMGTTCIAARFSQEGRRLYLAHIGDSRVYRLRGGALEQMTTDHTMENIGIQGARGSHLATALGADRCPKIDVLLVAPREGDTYLICSDGLSKMVSDQEIAATLQAARAPDAAARALIGMANAAGGKDNVTAVVIRLKAA